MYYIENENKEILVYDESLKRIADTLAFLPEYSKGDIKTVPAGYTIDNFKLVTVEQAQNRELQSAKENKYKQALEGAKEFINTGALYRYDDNNTIEATDGNIGKLTAYALGLQASIADYVTWTSKEDNVLTLNASQVAMILQGLGAVQANIWNVQYIAYKQAIENAKTVEELKEIKIAYTTDISDTVHNEVADTDTDTTAEQDNTNAH